MGEHYKALKEYIDLINLNIGDIIVDTDSGDIGILTKKDRHIDMVVDDIFIWHIKWSGGDSERVDIIEEEGLKLSIVIGTYDWHSVTGETYQL
jgi:hypothetical protein|tara:strand:+ start:2873 stop:3151 length:279 start_codon:yes stop_codon:yes gene_type:complete